MSVVVAAVVFALLASGSAGYLLRYVTAAAPGSTTPVVQRPVTQPGPVGDRWWQDSANPAAPPASAGDRWWEDPQFAAPTGAVPQRSDTRGRAY